MNIKKELETKVGPAGNMHLNNIDLDPLMIKAVMINEVVPADPLQDFYGIPEADYLKTTIPLYFYPGHTAAWHLYHKCRKNPKDRIHH